MPNIDFFLKRLGAFTVTSTMRELIPVESVPTPYQPERDHPWQGLPFSQIFLELMGSNFMGSETSFMDEG